MPKAAPSKTSPHGAGAWMRKLLSGLLGGLAVAAGLVALSGFGLQRVFTDNDRFTAAVGGLPGQPEASRALSNFIADKLLKDAPVDQLAAQLLPAEAAQLPPELRRQQLDSLIRSEISSIVTSPRFVAQWRATIAQTHQRLNQALAEDDGNLILELGPLLETSVSQLRASRLAAWAENIDLAPDQSSITVPSEQLNFARLGYQTAQRLPLLIAAAAALLAVLALTLSYKRLNSLRHMTLALMIGALGFYVLLKAAGRITLPSDGNEEVSGNALVSVLGKTLASGLLDIYLLAAVGGGLIAAALFGWQWYNRHVSIKRRPV